MDEAEFIQLLESLLKRKAVAEMPGTVTDHIAQLILNVSRRLLRR